MKQPGAIHSRLIYGILISVFALACVICGWWVAIDLFIGSNPITRIASYKKMLRKAPEAYCDHFPKTIPKNPERVRIYYFDTSFFFGQGGFGQGELWMKLERSEIEKAYAEFEKQAPPIKLPTDRNDTIPERFHTLEPNTPASGATTVARASLTTDFVIFPLATGSDSMWYRGVAISKQRSEIIYYAGYSYSM